MPVVFSSNTGRVTQITDKVAAGCLSLASVEKDTGQQLSFQVHKTIITRLGVSSAGNFQFLHTIGNDVYIYVFGDRMGSITLSGLSFEQNCATLFNLNDELAPSDVREEGHGFELLYNWYKQNRVAVRQKPISVTVGRNTTFQGFVTGLTGDVQDVQHRTVTFQLTLATLPTPG